MKNKIYYQVLIGISLAALLLHACIMIRLIPFEITWGGRLKSVEEMYVFETFSVFVNLFFIYIVLQKGLYVKPIFSPKVLTVVLWIFFVLFGLNTIGNMIAKTNFERMFTVVTFLSALLIWLINRNRK